MAIKLGLRPLPLEITLVRGGDFVASLIADEPWPAGTAIELRFSRSGGEQVIWPASIDAEQATWNIDAVAVQAVIDAQMNQTSVVYVENGVELVWMRGAAPHAR